VPVLQFYETTVLLTDGPRAVELSILTGSRDLVPRRGRGGVRSAYEDLLDDAVHRVPVGLGELPSALAFLAATEGIKGEERFDSLQLSSVAALTTHYVNRAAFETFPEFAGIGTQATGLPIVPIEASPLEKRTLVDILAMGGTASLCFFAGGPILVVIGVAGLATVRTLTGAWWRGAEPEVVEFGRDSAEWALDAIRERLGIKRHPNGRGN
jgi:hypothetical protein